MRLYDILILTSVFFEKEAKRQAAKVVSEKEVRKALHRDILQQSRFHTTSSPYGQLR